MELRQLRNFLQVCHSGSLSRAATVLNVAQPALSRQIRELETELGVSLFYRHGRGLALTTSGEHFRQSLGPILQSLDAACNEMATVRGVVAGKVTLAAPPSLMASIAVRMLADFRAKFPQIELHLVDGFSGYLFEWVMEGRADLAVLNGARKAANLAVEPLGSVSLHFAGLTDGQSSVADLINLGKIPFKSLTGVPLILPSSHHGLRREVERIAAENDVKLEILADVDSLTARRELLRSGYASTLIAPAAISTELAVGLVRSAPIVQPELLHRYVLAVPTERPVSTAMAVVSDYLREWGRGLDSAGTEQS